jgi:Tol biopolymer transport system component
VGGSYEMSYGHPLIAPDGSLLAFDKNNLSYIQDYTSSAISGFPDGRRILQWVGNAREYIFYRGNLTCPAIENLDDQVLLNFDLVRVNFDTPTSEIFLANVGGGLKFPQGVSENGQWASVMYCACYSECGANNLLNLTTGVTVSPPMSFSAGDFAFSPDSLFFVTATRQMFGYYQSPLYIANADYSGMTSIFSEPNSAPLWYRWSPGGQWIAMTLIYFDSDGMTITDSRVVLLRPDGSNVTIVDGTTANFIDWSPDGTQVLYSLTTGESSTLHIYDLASGVKTALPMMVSGSMYLEADWGRLP